ncbi:MAG TPA: ABC transporter permease [Streptosporangiaceae bacterium]|nr:ABC transporter permease [Streptosporangiaceae bacterium]
MIWLTWRQFRTQAAVTFGAITVLAAILAATGPQLAHLASSSSNDFLSRVSGADRALWIIGSLAVLAAPALMGLFWGAPLITRELDAGTYRLAWTQTTRTRWLAAKLSLLGLAAMTAAGLLSLAVTWWASPIDAAIASQKGILPPGLLVFPRLSPEMFAARGIAPLGYAAFFFVLGVTIGVAVRRTLPAMALLLTAFAVVQIGMTTFVRPHLIPAEQRTEVISAANLLNINVNNSVTVIGRPGAWVSSQQTINAAGQPAKPPSWVLKCPAGSAATSQACYARLAQLGYRQQITFQPASRFWPLQRNETVIYLVLTVVLAGLCTWWTRRLLS